MEKLVEEKLFGGGLVFIDSPELINRYNACLEDIGIEPTSLSSFSIDGIGWSPDIAYEKKDNFYLSHGGANQFAVILSPKQQNMPIYFPFYSFTRNLMNEVFDRYVKQIADVTTEAAIWIDFDQDISSFLNPLDLLLVDSIVIRVFTTNHIMDAAKYQRELIRQFTNGDAWFDAILRKNIIESAKTHGDLRYRSVLIPDIPFNDTRCFHTMAFDGVYVIRDILQKEPYLLILEDDDMIQNLGNDVRGVFSISDPLLPSILQNEGLVCVDPIYYRENPEALNLKREELFIDALSKHHPKIDFDKLSPGQRKKYTIKFKSDLPAEFFEIERLSKHISAGISINIEKFSADMVKTLMYPNPNLPASAKNLLWQLISEIKHSDIIMLYTYNKSRFFESYRIWPECKKKWAVRIIKERYIHRST